MASDEGDNPVAMHRLCTDGAIFRRIASRGQATILVDVSGSMQWESSDLENVLGICAGATVALYSGNRDLKSGILRIIAARGRKMRDGDERVGMSGWNICDGPALAWLARQPVPRIWMSDGDVRGVNDCSSPILTADVFHIASRGRIRRVADSAALAQALQEGR
jgi:hypothetical protein